VGAPAIRFSDHLEPDEEQDDSLGTVLIEGFPVLRDHPVVIFGDPGSAKSYFALYLAGELAKAFPVLYLDWELGFDAHNRRLRRLFDPVPKDLLYVYCAQPLVQESDRIRRLIQVEGIRYLIGDSVGMACAGRPEEAEHANAYMREIRGFKVGSLHLAHTSKRDSQDEGGKNEQRIYGSMFFTANARSIWFIQRAENSPKGQIQFGLFPRKASFGELPDPLAYTLLFQGRRIHLTRTGVEEVDELAAKLPLLDRMKQALSRRPLSTKALADDVMATPAVVRAMLSKHKHVFSRLDDQRVGLATPSMDFE